jgi:ribosomal protein S27E
MAKAKLICKSVEVLCSHCGETLPEPRTGSLFWVLTEITDLMVVTCDSCGQDNKIKIPARVATDL